MSKNTQSNGRSGASAPGHRVGGGGGSGAGKPAPMATKMETVGASTSVATDYRTGVFTNTVSQNSFNASKEQSGNPPRHRPADQQQHRQQQHQHHHHHSSETPANLWEIAAQEAKGKESLENKETSVIVVGSKGCGKTTLLNAFLEKRETPRETVALECSFGRKMQLGKVTKDIAQFWELGGGTAYLPLLEVAITSARLPTMTLIIVVDFTEAQEIWNVITKLHDQVASRVAKLKSKGRVNEATAERMRRLFQDSSLVDVAEKCPIALPVLIVINKYDLIQNLSNEQRRVLVSCLRVLSIVYGAALLFTDQNNKNLISRFKAFVNHLCFDHPAPTGVVFDYRNPVVVPWGKDNFESVGTPRPNWKYSSDKKTFVDFWRRMFEDTFKTTATMPWVLHQQGSLETMSAIESQSLMADAAFVAGSGGPPDPSVAFPEAAVDAARHAKRYEADRLRREKEKERKEKEEKERREAETRSQTSKEDATRAVTASNGSDLSSIRTGFSHESTMSKGAMKTIAEDEDDQDVNFQ